MDDVTFSHNGEFTDNWLYNTCGDINVIIVPYLCQLYVKLSYVSVTVTALKYALFVKVSDRSERFIKLIQFYLNDTINLRLLTRRIRPISCYTYKMAIVS